MFFFINSRRLFIQKNPLTFVRESLSTHLFYLRFPLNNYFSAIAACAAIASCRTLDQANCWIIFSTLDL